MMRPREPKPFTRNESINTASSGSGRVDDTEGHLQGEIRGPTKLVKMQRCDKMDGQTRECETAAAFESTEQVGSERHGWQGTGLTLDDRERCVRSHNRSEEH